MRVVIGDDVRSAERVSRRTLRLCTAVAALVVIAAVPTFFVDGILNGTPVMNGSARGTALTMFALALPVLAVGVVTSIRGSVDQWFGHRADPTSDVASLAGSVLFVGLAVATLVPLALWLRAVPAQTPEAGRS